MSGTVEGAPAAESTNSAESAESAPSTGESPGDPADESAAQFAAKPTEAAEPSLSVHTSGSAPVTGIVLLLHGGRVASTERVSPWNLPLARMRMFVSPLQTRIGTSGVAVAVLRDRYQGWNGAAADAYVDAVWALDRIAAGYGPIPVALIGHSMGGRAALRAGGHPSVTGIAALAPWTPSGEPVEQLLGRTVMIAHGDQDRQIAPAESLEYAVRAKAAGVEVCRLKVEGSGHALLSRLADWNLLAVEFALAMVGAKPMPTPVAAAFAEQAAAPAAPAERPDPPDASSADADLAGLDMPLPRDWRRRWH